MAGTITRSSGHNTQHHANSSSSNNNNTSNSNAAGGRERAIEALIDREPQGDYYRAARVIDEAVPLAQTSRPNLITKTALVEQAFALSRFDIDSLSKYDEQYLHVSYEDHQHRRSNSETRKVDALQKERVFHYQAQVIATKVTAQSPSTPVTNVSTSHDTASNVTTPSTTTPSNAGALLSSSPLSLAVAPPPNLVAALRLVFDTTGIEENTTDATLSSALTKLKLDTKTITRTHSSSGQFELRQLLQSIANHPVFTANVAPSAVAVAAQQAHTTSVSCSNVDEQQINLEKLMMSVTKQLTSNSEDNDKETRLQSLLIAILSLLTSSQISANVNNSTMDDQQSTEFAKIMSEPKPRTPKPVDRQDDDLPPQSVLQIGALLSLLPLDSAPASQTLSTLAAGNAAIIDIASTDSATHRLNPELLDYFASAAAIYQERWEIRKARRLARMQTPPPHPSSELTTCCNTPPPSLVVSPLKRKGTATNNANDDNTTDNEESKANDEQQHDDDGRRAIFAENAETPTAGGGASPDMEFSLRTEDDDDLVSTPTNNNSATPINSDSTNIRNIDPPASSDTDVMVGSDRDEQGLMPTERMNDSSDDENGINDVGPSDNDGDAEVIPFDMTSELIENMSRNIGERPDDDEEQEIDDDDEDDDDEPSSSSGSDSSDDDGEDGMGDSDDAGALDTDDDEEAVLRQAMAMSMAEQEEQDIEAQATSLVARTLSSLGIGSSTVSEDSKIVPVQDDKALPIAETLVSKTNNREDHMQVGEENDETNLPPFPNPPKSYHLLLPVMGSIARQTALELPNSQTNASASPISQLDPSKLSDFGSIPSYYILFHLLRYTSLELDHLLAIRAKENSSPTVVPGGVGSSLYALKRSSMDQTESSTQIDKKADVTIQLLVASTLLMIKQRNEAIENLRKSITREQRMVHDGTYDSDDENTDTQDDDESSRLPLSLSGEEDDPALTLAMNYVEDDAPLSSESLESKGMTRKAAAAAYDAAAMMKSLRTRTNCWKHEVKLASSCVVCSLQILRKYLQSMVRRYFFSKEMVAESINCQSVSDFYSCLSEFVKLNFSRSLESLMSIGTQSSLLAMMSGDVTETERLFQSCSLYKETLAVWGECIPLLYHPDIEQSSLLKTLIDECSGFANPLSHLISPKELKAFPNSDVETQFYKVSTLCCRLRISDLLDVFVSRPLHFAADMSANLKNDDTLASADFVELTPPLHLASDLITFLGNSIGSMVGDHSELKYFYFALCHRCQCRAILLDDFYLETETELDDKQVFSSAANTLATGDTVRVAAHPSTALQFDATKCSDSIAVYTGLDDDSRVVSTGIYSVHQRASKVWGTVLSTQQYSPKTGVHRWAVRLDKCERGHVFIGVATSQATMKTYVGGDKYGWGMIGTQALWHDRRKIRGDYGSTFRTSSTIIVTLDTDAGTLSFSAWKDGSTSSSLSVDPLIQNIVSPKKGGQIGGIVDDWGVAFEGLPHDAKLYPAIALYQRDDRVTLLTVESPNSSRAMHGSDDIAGGRCYYPWLNIPSQKLTIHKFANHVRQHNDLLTWDGIRYACAALKHAISSIRNNDMADLILTSIVPSLAASLCLLPPSIPILSARCASFLMPQISSCILELERLLLDTNQHDTEFLHGSIAIGHWIIRTANSDGTGFEYEEYEMDITKDKSENGSIYFKGKCTPGTSGKSKGAYGKVNGCVIGSSVVFVEDWYSVIGDDESLNSLRETECCVATARLSIDGRGFEGIFRKSASGSAGQVAGRIFSNAGPFKSTINGETSLGSCAAVLCLAQSHLATILGDNATSDLDYFRGDKHRIAMEAGTNQVSLKAVLTRPLLSNTSSRRKKLEMEEDVLSLLKQYHPPKDGDNATVNFPSANILTNLNDFMLDVGRCVDESKDAQIILARQVFSVDSFVTLKSGGLGSFSSLCPSIYTDVRKIIICAVLYHSGFDETRWDDEPLTWTPEFFNFMKLVWCSSLRILEDGVRKALSTATARSARDKCSDVCDMFTKTSAFLLSLNVNNKTDCRLSVQEVATEISYLFTLIGNESDLMFIEEEMILATRRGLLRYSSLCEIVRIVDLLNSKSTYLIESLLVGLPRQLGRGKGEGNYVWRTAVDDNLNSECIPYLDGNYLFRLSGSDHKIVSGLRKLVMQLFTSLGRISEQVIASRRSGGANMYCFVQHDSLMLSILATFINHFRQEDFDDIIASSHLLVFLPDVLALHRYSILQNLDTDQIESDSPSQCASLEKLFQRDVSRAILRCSVALAHIVTYQGTMDVGVSFSRCIDLILSELDLAFSLVEKDSLRTFEDAVSIRTKNDWQYYLVGESGNGVGLSQTTSKIYVSGLRYLQLHGSLLTNFSHVGIAKSSQSHKSSAGMRQVTDVNNNVTINFAQQFLSHWLHIMCSVLRSKASINYILIHNGGLEMLLNRIGLSLKHSDDGTIHSSELLSQTDSNIPGRFRSRLIRLMLPLLSSMKASESLVRGLFFNVGSFSTILAQCKDIDEWMVSRETISLLRHLYISSNAQWKDCINGLVDSFSQQGSYDALSPFSKIGILSFISGSLDPISRGSYVIIKPSAASVLSHENQSLPSGKSHLSGIGGSSLSSSGSGSTPHHLIGNGTSAVITGMCNVEASAGIVSNVDLKNGSCEIILVARSQIESREKGISSDGKNFRSTAQSKNVLGGRHTLTVRAVRTALADVVHAQEVPLCLDASNSFESLLANFITSSLDRLVTTDHFDETFDAASDLLTLRCCIVVLSHERRFSSFLSRPNSKSILSKLLEVAWPRVLDQDTVGKARLLSQNKSISHLIHHEGRFSHLVFLLRDLDFRVMTMKKLSDSEKEMRLKQFRDAATSDASVPAGINLKTTTPISSDATSFSEVVSNSGESRVVAQEGEANTGRSTSHSTATSSGDDEEENSEAATTAAINLREAAIVQMSELGLPRSWSEYALRRTGGVNIEAAVTFCLERGPEIERMIVDEQERDRMTHRDFSSGSSRRRGNRDSGPSGRLLRQLLEMGFPKRWCAEALSVTGNNVDEALTWILNNGERLSEEDEAIDASGENEEANENDTESVDDEEEDDDIEGNETPGADDNNASDVVDGLSPKMDSALQETVPCWSGSITPLSFISGRAIVNPINMEISGLPAGGFSSVGTKGILLCSGKWYYEAILETAGCLQIGWADGSFAGHCHAERGDGCGDGPSSWAFDGWRRYRWHATATEWGCRWKEGDVVGCLVDMDLRIISFTLNGEGESIGMGVAFTAEGFRPCGGVYACVSFNRKEKLRLILGGSGSEPFKHLPPTGYRGVGEAVIEAVEERDFLLTKEQILDFNNKNEKNEAENKRFLCDFSDTDHGHELTAWAHRYYGSDASVHLGSGRSKHSVTKSFSSYSASDQLYSPHLTRRLQQEWEQFRQKTNNVNVVSYEDLAAGIFEGYENVRKTLKAELSTESVTTGLLLARKLLLHLVVTAGQDFDLNCFMMDSDNHVDDALRFYNVVEACTSLRHAGWIGEAGAMAIAAEALGLCISSNDQLQPRSNSDRRGVVIANDLDENLQIPVGGYTQILTSVLTPIVDGVSYIETCQVKAAAAEAAMGSDGGSGILAFLKDGLQSATSKSKALREVIVAKVRRGVRLLAVVEYENDDSDVSGKKEDDGDDDAGEAVLDAGKIRDDSGDAEAVSIDARLIAFFSGILLSRPGESIEDIQSIQKDLFEAWSIGLLSASLPWRMICAFTAAGILNQNQAVFVPSLKGMPSLVRYFGRLQSTFTRRLWAERAAVPVCSRYSQSFVELLTSVHRSVAAETNLPKDFQELWETIHVDAATPLPAITCPDTRGESWESYEGWVSSDSGWEVWTGVVEINSINWKVPSRSNVRTLMDGGDGPPLVRKGSIVMRGMDWDQMGNDYGSDDGKDLYDAEKANREKDKADINESTQLKGQEPDNLVSNSESGNVTIETNSTPDPADESENAGISSSHVDSAEEELRRGSETFSTAQPVDSTSEEKKFRKLPSPRLPIGTVVAIEPWNGIPGMARRVMWHLTGKESVYRFGGDGGKYDLCNVEVNSKETKIKKRHPLPESSEQCAARHGFGVKSTHSILLRIRQIGKESLTNDLVDYQHDGILEWPDFGAGISVKCFRYADGTIAIEENEMIFGSKDSGWIPRFGQPSYVTGSRFVLSPQNKDSNTMQKSLIYEELLGRSEFNVDLLRNPADGNELTVSSEMRLYRGFPTSSSTTCKLSSTFTPLPPPLTFDRDCHASSLSLSRDCRTVSCASSDSGRGTAFGAMGFTKGVHYWEVKLEQADIGSVFIGVAEKPSGSGSGSSYIYDTPPRLNRWHGWGFVNFRATYTAGAERVFGSHCHAGDTVGVMLDCDAGRVSFFFDGLKYGEHILNDLGCAFENLSPFGFNVDGCGSGGAGQGAPSGFENGSNNRFPAQGTTRPRTLWPVVGLRNHGDRVTISPKWSTSLGTDGVIAMRNIVKVDEIMSAYFDTIPNPLVYPAFPKWFVSESFSEYKRWISDSWTRCSTRGSGPSRDTGMCLDVDFDSSPIACAAASASLGVSEALLAGDRVKLTRSAGRILQLAEEAVVVGVYQGRLYYRIVSQKSEGGSLTEGGGRAWCWDESEVVDGLPFALPSKGRGVLLPPLSRFSHKTALKVVYDSGAVLRSDLEIFDGSETLGTISVGSIIPNSAIIDRRINSCGGVRFRVRSESLGEGWISERIRGGSEELIVECIDEVIDSCTLNSKQCFDTPLECAAAWYDSWKKHSDDEMDPFLSTLAVSSVEEFTELISRGTITGLSFVKSDSILTAVVNAISNYSFNGDAVESSFKEVARSVAYAHATTTGAKNGCQEVATSATNQDVSAILAKFSSLPPLKALLARISLLRSFNRRAKFALPWLSIRPCQEGSAILGGLYGYGTSPDRSGRCQDDTQSNCWIQVPSIATKIRSLRGIFFTSVKRSFLLSVIDATTTSTLLSHDEYELPREIRTVRINRLKAARAMLGDDVSAKRKYSVFSQLNSETKSWGGASLRRGFVAKGHGGQKRAFKVKLIGEGVNDYSGPYREAFTDAMADVLKIESSMSCSLSVLDPTPNHVTSIGENRDLYMFSLNGRNLASLNVATNYGCPSHQHIRRNFASLMVGSDESSREVEESLVFLGRLVGTAFRHGIPLDIPLPLYSVWKALVEEPVLSSQKLLELDHLAHKHLDKEDDANKSLLLSWQQRMLNAFTEGLGNVIPVEILPLLTGEELREIMCGNPNVDVELLKQVVEYEGFSPTDDVITNFWSTLNEMTNDERKQFLQFVWARNRLPMRESDFDAPFKIQKDTSKGEEALPSASTCFFTLTLPEYTNQETLREKLLFAIRNVTTMETDFQTNSAEIAEGYRSF